MSGPAMSPQEFRARLTRLAEGALPDLLQDLARDAAPLIVAGAIGHMRDAKGEARRRRASDDGPLRIVTGDYARGLRGKTGGSIERVGMDGPLRAKLEKGVRLDRYPQAYNEDRYPTLAPGLADAEPRIRTVTQRRFVATVRRLIRGSGTIPGNPTPAT